MKIESVKINNFRLLKEINLTFEDITTVIVGRNNSGKTSLAEIFRRFFYSKSFCLEDFNMNVVQRFKEACDGYTQGRAQEEVRNLIPSIDLIITFKYSDSDYSLVNDFIIDFEEESYLGCVKLSYTLRGGQIDNLFLNLSSSDNEFCIKLKERIPKLFNITVTAIDPNDENNIKDLEYKVLSKLLRVDFINAQRGLDDNTANEKDVLGKILSDLFKTSSRESAPEDMKSYYDQVDEIISQLQEGIKENLAKKIKLFLPALSLFGYPGLSDPNIDTITSFSAQTLLDGHTKVMYGGESASLMLPESYNGLGSRNLIFILFQLYSYFRDLQSQEITSSGHVIFIEEPEAHLHPQMQEVFINQLNNVVGTFSRELNGDIQWPVQFLVSTHSTHIANKADFSSIRYFSQNAIERTTKVKDLKTQFRTEENQEDRNFINKYLTLTKCDLYFSDKAILIEGAAERIMMAPMIKKVDELSGTNLATQYVTFIEIGGAYAHHFYKFLDFLELKSLVITDIDSIKSANGEACPVCDGLFTSNSGIKKWFSLTDPINLDDIKSKTSQEKIITKRRIAYQIPENLNTIPCGRSFEDAFILANKGLFNITGRGRALERRAYKEASKYDKKKTDFALKYALDNTAWQVPRYIKEGLQWLASNE